MKWFRLQLLMQWNPNKFELFLIARISKNSNFTKLWISILSNIFSVELINIGWTWTDNQNRLKFHFDKNRYILKIRHISDHQKLTHSPQLEKCFLDCNSTAVTNECIKNDLNLWGMLKKKIRLGKIPNCL